MFSNKLIKGLTLIVLSASFSLSTIQSAFARPGTLSDVPLFLSSIVEPNVFLTMDDSGSMDWGPMQSVDSGVAAGSNGLPVIDGRRRAYYTPTFTNLYTTGQCYFVVPPFTNGAIASWDATWVIRHHLSNRTYYNPAVKYEPWRGTRSDGTAMYGPASETAALEHPDGSEESINLTVLHTYTEPNNPSNNCNGGPNRNATAAMWVPTYYTWPDNNADGVIDARDIGDGDNILEASDMTTAEIQAAEVRIAAGTAEMQNFANWFQYYRSRMNAAKSILGSTINNTDASRIGLRWFNDGHQMNVESMSNPDDKRALQEVIYDYDTRRQGTPARTALRNTGRYFDATDSYTYDALNGNDIEPILPAANGGECQQNFNILMSDGFWNSSTGPGVGNTDRDSSGVTDNGFDGDKNESVDDGFYEDGWSDTLADVAMKYYESDLSSLINNVPTTTDVDEADHQHLVTYTIAFGLKGTLDPAVDDPLSVGFSWPQPVRNTATTVDDMWHAAYNGRGLYLGAHNPGALLASLNTAIADIADRTASAAAVSINTTKLNVDTVVYLAEFNTNRWHGDLKAFKIQTIDVNNTPSDPTDDILDPSGTLNAFPEWRAATQLDARWDKASAPGEVSPPRVIYTYNGTRGTPFKTLTNLTPGQQADLNMGPTGAADGNGQLRLDYLRGDRSLEGNGLRERLSLLGDLVNSGPVYVGAPTLNWPDTAPFPTGASRYSDFKDGAAASRVGVIYAAANDGMLHGFAEADGEEVMAYIPNNLFSSATGEGMHYLTEPNYKHRYYNDLTPTLSDIYADLGDGLAWQTILINGERGGGRGIYALNVNDPNNFTDAKADKIALWEFSSKDDIDLGYTYSQPQIAYTNDKRWVAIFGNGYNNLGDGKAKLFVLDIEGGIDGWDAADVIEIDTGVGDTGDPNGLSTPRLADLDGDGTVDRVYAGDVHGNMWAFDMSGGSTPSIVGGVPIFTTIGGEPITTPPVLAKHPTISNDGTNYPNVMVYFGSGQYLTNGDKTDTSLNHFYGIWDNAAQNISTLHQQNFQSGFTDTFGNSVRVLTNTPVNYAGGESGWYFGLEDPGEKLIFEPSLRGGIVFFNTFVPDPDPCGEGGDSWAMFVDMVNGGSADDPQSDTDNSGIIDDNDRVSNSSNGGTLMTSSGSKGEGELYPNNNFLGDLVYRGDDPDEIKELRDIPTGRFSWQELIQ